MATGRKKDMIWDFFEKKQIPGKMGIRAECKTCKKDMAGLVARMKSHHAVCHLDTDCEFQEDDPPVLEKADQVTESRKRHSSDSSSATTSKKHASSLDKFVVRTSRQDKELFDAQVARFIYATNSPFTSVDHPEFKKLLGSMRPGYKPPNRHDVGGKLLNKEHENVLKSYGNHLKGETVCAALDGWSNIHNEPIVGFSVSCKGQVYLVDSIDTSGHPHEFHYLCEIASDAISRTEKNYGCIIGSFVTDNAANVVKMRNALKAEKSMNI